ncbi:pyruvate carboxylase subunit A [Archaeoglobus sulfaticallidus PM70-1]|uniref:Pyruvate carboxylase subunit A n=1 Tax=Archaeoglobus sulfaticallidus PM70-1 TaxID=387631 RepID=N0BGB8_9EURY|nr:acetyl-CoA carboxylase biotin carboxylase subunit [Archaeoglobus sulfaticallidus]AGK62023.1 pyruvate carboxylase subunit A [Archaeoglobus sulfaticallidus PM70-1]
MFSKILVANRGEVAVRVMRACKEMGIKTVAVYSDADRKAFHRVYANECYYIGDSDPKKSYLNMDKIIDVAKKSDSEAIHPGYGFLSENAEFAKRCEEEGIVFIGPPSKVISAMGSKVNARKLMRNAGVPVIPGSDAIETLEEAKAFAEKIGYPVAVKASGGGGGIGINIANNEGELERAFKRSKKLGESYFKDPSVYIEKYLPKPRHIEFQILADDENVVHLGERECSIQRRHQKLIEEAPSPVFDEEMREKFGRLAVKGAKYIGYRNAGTMEFLYQDGELYFLEMNTRLQVEHTVTEMVTGIDIVKEQIRIASGMGLSFDQEEVVLRGHAIECRINAEDPVNFLPRSGVITHYRSPGGTGIRVDSGVHQGYEIPPYYDSMISKLLAWGRTREGAIAKMKRALYEYIIDGVETNIPFHMVVLDDPDFVSGNIHTKFVDEKDIPSRVKEAMPSIVNLKKRLDEIFNKEEEINEKIIAIAISAINAYKRLESEIGLVDVNTSESWKIDARIKNLRWL